MALLRSFRRNNKKRQFSVRYAGCFQAAMDCRYSVDGLTPDVYPEMFIFQPWEEYNPRNDLSAEPAPYRPADDAQATALTGGLTVHLMYI